MLSVRSPPILAFSSRSKFRSSPIFSLALPFPPPLLVLFFGIGGRPLSPEPPSVLASAFCLFFRRRRRRLLPVPVVLVVCVVSVDATDSVSLSMRSPDRSMFRLLFPGLGRVTGTGPPGPPRRRGGDDDEPAVLVLGELVAVVVVEDFGLEAVSGEDIL